MKTRGRVWVIFAIACILINLLLLLLPFEKSATFVVTWAGLVLMLVIDAIALKTAMGKRTESAQGMLFGRKLLKTTACLTAVQLILTVAMLILGKDVPFAAVLIGQIVLLLIAVAVLLRSDMTRATVQRVEAETKANVASIKELRIKADGLCAGTADPANEKALKQLADELRYSDPVSNAQTASYEKRIGTILDSLANQDKPEERAELIRRALALVKERAAVAKSSK